MKNIELSPIKKFILFYIIYITILFTLVEYSYFQSLLQINSIYSTLVTRLSAAAMEPFVALTYSANFIYLPGETLEIKFGCNGLEAVMLYISAILAYPASLKNKIYGLIIGFIVINIINIIRVMILGYVILEYNPYFDMMHTYVTQNIMIVFVFFAFIVYLHIIENHDAKSKTTR